MEANVDQVTVRVPASTSNLGPGYDCLGVALRLYNRVTLERAKRSAAPKMALEAAARFFARANLTSFPMRCRCVGDVPVARGLGSSVTLRLGTILGLNALADRPLTRVQCFDLCAELEGHPDNAAPAAFGGFNVINTTARQRFAVSAKLKFVLLIPDYEVSTTEARRLLPANLSHGSAVTNCANACAITAGFVSGDYEKLRGAFADHLHQPFRKKLIAGFDEIIAAAEGAGALGAFLSGSGSTIAAVTLRDATRVAEAMHRAGNNRHARTIITSADNHGARIESGTA